MQGRRIQAKATTPEMYVTIDQLVTRLAAQIRKHKERQADHKGQSRNWHARGCDPLRLRKRQRRSWRSFVPRERCCRWRRRSADWTRCPVRC